MVQPHVRRQRVELVDKGIVDTATEPDGIEHAGGTGRPRSHAPIWLLSVFMLGLAALLCVLERGDNGRFGPRLSVPWWALAIAFALAEVRALHLRFRGETHSITLNEIVLVVGLFAASPSAVVAAQF